ncbi:hypothetical protein [Aureimonas ureilytica]|uniref:hypothetical protein n=1 Tax=Aureimonas ureilytica TaxID=401562 RepID=UPI000A639074|nr:hypothetical protein [Aureimonas ureilytica]
MSGLDQYDSDIFEAIEELVAEGALEVGTVAHGIALKVVDDGYESLTPKQR